MDEVTDSRHGMKEQHSRTGITHDGPHFFAHGRLVAMHGASLASCLLIAERTTVQSCVSVLQQSLALGAKLTVSLCPSAVEAHHLFHGLFLSFNDCHNLILGSYRAQSYDISPNVMWILRIFTVLNMASALSACP